MNNFEDLHDIQQYTEYTRSHQPRYVAEVRHLGLGSYRLLKDMNSTVLYNKIVAQFVTWDNQWERQVLKNEAIAEKEYFLQKAEEQTLEAQRVQNEFNEILLSSLNKGSTFQWDKLYDQAQFEVQNPKERLDAELKKVHIPKKPIYRDIPTVPDKENYIPKLSLLDKVLKSRKKRKIDDIEALYQNAINLWEKEVESVNSHNKNLQDIYNQKIEESEEVKAQVRKWFDRLEENWEIEKQSFYKEQEARNKQISSLKENYENGKESGILDYCKTVLNTMEYPNLLPKKFNLEYNKDIKTLIIEFSLPAPEDMPTLLSVRYIATRKELKETHQSALQLSKQYDNVIYQIVLRTLFEIFTKDQIDAVKSIVFNGWVKTINKAVGKETNSCIVSIQTTKEEFLKIELENVDPKACFKNLKGIGSSKLSGVIAIKPIAQISKQDKRFVDSYSVAENIQEGDNLASMHWEDFEHLIREIFEVEFKSNGGEVKVTQTSRDGGVDAIAFDPDPIRGGKIVIQAKRYTNTVGVTAVRDLYGTVMNEGATKGILVTTSDYGPDAYQFAKNKPLTLMNGANLLFLLEKHGHKARIDIPEARRLMK